MKRLKRYLIILLGLVVVALVPFYVLPFFIDVKDMQQAVSSKLQQEIGKQVSVDGEVNFIPLPIPHFKVHGMRVENHADASTKYFMTSESLHVYPGILSLLIGKISVSQIKFINPTIELENFIDSQPNWLIEGGKANTDDSILDGIRINVENGTVYFRSGYREEPLERVIAIDEAAFVIRSLAGPYTGYGLVRPKFVKTPMTFELETGKLREGRGAEFNFGLRAGESNVGIVGDIFLSDSSPVIRGDLTTNINDSIMALGRNFGLDRLNMPELLDAVLSKEETSITSSITLSSDGARLSNIVFNSLSTDGAGDVSIIFGARNQLDIDMVFNAIDMDALTRRARTIDNQVAITPGASLSTMSEPMQMSLPEDISLRLKLGFNEATFRQHENITLSLDAEFSDGKTIVHSFKGEGLPGNASIDWSGQVIEKTDESDSEIFKGKVVAEGDKVIPLLEWMNVSIPLGDRKGFDNFSVDAAIEWSEQSISFKSLRGALGEMQVKGRALVDFKDEVVVNAAFNFSDIDMDRYAIRSTGIAKISDDADANLAMFDFLRSADFAFDKLAVAFNVGEFKAGSTVAQDVSGVLRARKAYIELDKFSFKSDVYGKVSIDADIDSSELKPVMNLGIFIERLDAEKLEEATGISDLLSTSTGAEIGWPSHEQKQPPSWSTESINFSHLAIFDGSFDLAIQEFVNSAVPIQGAKFKGTINNEQITVTKFDARVFSSRIEGSGAFGLNRPYIQAAFSISNSDLAKVGYSLFGYEHLRGKGSFSGSITGAGYSVAQLMSSLYGKIQFIGRDIEMDGFDLKRIKRELSRMATIDEIRRFKADVFSGGQTDFNYVSGEMVISEGALTARNINIADPTYTQAEFNAYFNLTNWTMNVDSTFGLLVDKRSLKFASQANGNIYDFQTTWDKNKNLEKYWEDKFYTRY